MGGDSISLKKKIDSISKCGGGGGGGGMITLAIREDFQLQSDTKF